MGAIYKCEYLVTRRFSTGSIRKTRHQEVVSTMPTLRSSATFGALQPTQSYSPMTSRNVQKVGFVRSSQWSESDPNPHVEMQLDSRGYVHEHSNGYGGRRNYMQSHSDFNDMQRSCSFDYPSQHACTQGATRSRRHSDVMQETVRQATRGSKQETARRVSMVNCALRVSFAQDAHGEEMGHAQDIEPVIGRERSIVHPIYVNHSVSALPTPLRRQTVHSTRYVTTSQLALYTVQNAFAAVENRNSVELDRALASGCDPNTVDFDGVSLLTRAVSTRAIETVQLVLKYGGTGTALGIAAQNGDTAIVDLLLQYGADINEGEVTPLMAACRNGHVHTARCLLVRGAKSNGKSTAMHCAAISSSAGLVDLLASYGETVNARDASGRTPLFCAVMKGNVDVVRALLQHGSNPDIPSDDGATALMWAARLGHRAIAALLIDFGANVNYWGGRMQDDRSRSPLMWAMIYADDAMVELLRSKGAVIKAQPEPEECICFFPFFTC